MERNRSKKYRKELKRIRLKNKKLIQKYPWLIPRNVWNDQVVSDYNYEYVLILDEMPSGWRKAFGLQLIEEMNQSLIKDNCVDTFRIQQCKEKFGTLRIYCSGYSEDMMEILYKYETISVHVCVYCGKPDVPITKRGWIYPCCEHCYKHGDYKEDFDLENSKIPDNFTLGKYSNEGTTSITYDIKPTVDIIRKRWENKHHDKRGI